MPHPGVVYRKFSWGLTILVSELSPEARFGSIQPVFGSHGVTRGSRLHEREVVKVRTKGVSIINFPYGD